MKTFKEEAERREREEKGERVEVEETGGWRKKSEEEGGRGRSPSDHSTGLTMTATPRVCVKVTQVTPEPKKKWFSASPTPLHPALYRCQGISGESYTIQHVEEKKRKNIKIHMHT